MYYFIYQLLFFECIINILFCLPVVTSEISCLDDEPDLQLAIEEPEAWSITVDRKVSLCYKVYSLSGQA